MHWENISFILFQVFVYGIFIFILQKILQKTLEPKSLCNNYLTFSDYNKLINELQKNLKKESESDIKILSVRLEFLEQRLERIENALNDLQKEIRHLIESRDCNEEEM